MMIKKVRIITVIILFFGLAYSIYIFYNLHCAEKLNSAIIKNDFSNVQLPADFDEKILFWKAYYVTESDQNEAIKTYQAMISIAENNGLKADALYNLGCIFAKRGIEEKKIEFFNAAADYYKESLRIKPNNEKAKYNLETVLKIIAKITQEQKAQNGKEQGEEGKNINEGEDSMYRESDAEFLPPASSPALGNDI